MIQKTHMIEEHNMNKLRVTMLFGIFVMGSFLAMNLYTGTSFPGYGGNEACNNCHNEPIFAKNVDVSFGLGDWAASEQAFTDNGQWSTNEVPVIQTNNRSDANLEFIRSQFLENSTHFMAMFEVDDTTPTTGTSSATSDKFAVIFNIDEANFTVGDFLNNYNSSSTNLDQILDGQMGFKGDGHADLWWVDMAQQKLNTTGKAMDYYISSNYVSDGSSHQDVYYAVWYGLLAVHGSRQVWGYRIWFVRSLTTDDANDVQFTTQGAGIQYAIASWQDSAAEYHHSSFDQMLVLGNEIGIVSTVTSSKTSGTASAFTAAFVLAGLVIAIPVVSKLRKKSE